MSSQPIYLGALGYLALLLVGLVELAVGLWFLKMGLWPKRQGDTPHCAKCGYNLTGLASERCPECGRELAGGGTVHGERRRSPAKVIIAGFFMLPAVLVGAFIATSVDWYRLAPTFLLVSDLQSSNPTRAWNELDARIKAGKLSAGQRSRIIDIGLKEQVSSRSSQTRDELVNQLGRWVGAGLVSDAQAEKFYGQLVSVSLRVPPQVVKGEWVPVELRAKALCPNNLTVRIDEGEVLMDGKRVLGGSSSVFSGLGSANISIGYFPCGRLGSHKLETRPKVSVHLTSPADTLLRQWTEQLHTTFELVEPTATRPVANPTASPLASVPAG